MAITDINSDDKKQAFAVGALFASDYFGLGSTGNNKAQKNNILTTNAYKSTLIPFSVERPLYDGTVNPHDITKDGVTVNYALTIAEFQDYLTGYLQACGHKGSINKEFFRDSMNRGDDTNNFNCRYIFAGVSFYLKNCKMYFGAGFSGTWLKRFQNTTWNGLIEEDYYVDIYNEFEVSSGWWNERGFISSGATYGDFKISRDSTSGIISSVLGNICECNTIEDGFLVFNGTNFLYPVSDGHLIQYGKIGDINGYLVYHSIEDDTHYYGNVYGSQYSTYNKGLESEKWVDGFMQSFNPWNYTEEVLNTVGLTLPTVECDDGTFYLLEDCFFVPTLYTSYGRHFYKIEDLEDISKYCIIAYMDCGLYTIVDKGTMEF